jgi:hypothetical protein
VKNLVLKKMKWIGLKLNKNWSDAINKMIHSIEMNNSIKFVRKVQFIIQAVEKMKEME